MKKLLIMVLSFCCLYSLCSCEREEEPADTFEFNVQKLFGDYNLTNIHWPGLAVDLNNDDEGVGYWSLLYEFQNKIGYYEPAYTATVTDGKVFNDSDKPSASFIVTIPCPNYLLSDGKWVCSGLRDIKVTLRANEENFLLATNCCEIVPGYRDPEDVFLASIRDISLVVMSYDDSSFKVGLHCTLPHDNLDGTQELNENYLYYEFSKGL
jgi:hypothetical protein